MAACFQFRAQHRMIVDFAVVNDALSPILAEHRLVSARNVDDAQSLVPKTHALVQKQATVVCPVRMVSDVDDVATVRMPPSPSSPARHAQSCNRTGAVDLARTVTTSSVCWVSTRKTHIGARVRVAYALETHPCSHESSPEREKILALTSIAFVPAIACALRLSRSSRRTVMPGAQCKWSARR